MDDRSHQEELDRLTVDFEAALARDEELAADELAFSLRQDLSLEAALGRSPSLAVRGAGGSQRSVEAVGADFLALAGEPEVYIPLARALMMAHSQGPRPERVLRPLVSVLRERARAGAHAEVLCDMGTVRGRLVRATSDHLALDHGEVEMLVPWTTMIEISLSRGDSADAS